MTDALTPAQALEYLRTLSADIEEAAVLAADGSLLAGPDASGRAGARAAGRRARGRRRSRSRPPSTASSPPARDRHAVVLVCGRFALPALVRFDLRMVLADLAGERRDVA